MIKGDKELLWRPGRIYYPAMFFTGMSVGAINEGGAANDAYGVNWEGSHTGAPISKEISTFGINGVLLDTNTDAVGHEAPIPYDLDPRHPVYARVVWTSGSVDTADTVQWTVTYKQLTPNVTALATGATALDTVIAAQDVPVATAYALCKTAWGKINGGTILDTAEHWTWNVAMTTFDVGLSEDKFLLGLEIAYTPRRLQGVDGMQMPSKFPAYALAKNING